MEPFAVELTTNVSGASVPTMDSTPVVAEKCAPEKSQPALQNGASARTAA
jgi:hypothetical protein